MGQYSCKSEFPNNFNSVLQIKPGEKIQRFKHLSQITGQIDTSPHEASFLLCSECLGGGRRAHLAPHEHLEERIIWSRAPVATHACDGQSLQDLRLCGRVKPWKMGQRNTLLIHPLALHPGYQVQ
jgi:hypothetical protein